MDDESHQASRTADTVKIGVPTDLLSDLVKANWMTVSIQAQRVSSRMIPVTPSVIPFVPRFRKRKIENLIA